MTTVFYENIPIAQLNFRDEWQMSYEPSWEARPNAFPISLTMPLRSGGFGAATLLPWLTNLLPETHLTEIGLRLKVSPQDIVGLLEAIGRDTAGALSIGKPRKPGIHLMSIPDDRSLERIIGDLPERPFLVGEHGVSMSLAGVQEKLPVFVADDGTISIPVEGTPSTHILKPDTRRLAGSVENEAFCLSLARACGLDAADATIGHAGTRRYLLVKRYDRFLDSQRELRRLHQEDLCQLTGHFPYQKYERTTAGRGVGLKQMFDTVRDLISPGERLRLLDAVIFNVLICNSDSHAKNYSILIGARGTARMAPLYDLMCAAVYDKVDQNLPQSVGGKAIAAELHGRHWKAFAEEVGLSPAATVRRVGEIGDMVVDKCDQIAADSLARAGDPSRVLERIRHAIKRRCRRILHQL